MTDAFTQYIERKIKEATAKRDAMVLAKWEKVTSNEDLVEYMHQLRIWWCYESKRQAYEDSLIQYKLTRR
jgi:hypothetical protein